MMKIGLPFTIGLISTIFVLIYKKIIKSHINKNTDTDTDEDIKSLNVDFPKNINSFNVLSENKCLLN